jgi:rhodanese/phosphatase family protein
MGTGGLFLRRLRAKVSDEPSGFVWVVKGKVAGSGFPASRKQLEWLAAQGIDTILTLTPNPIPADWLQGLPLTTEHMPMSDHGVPDLAVLDRGAQFIQTKVREGKTVLVHCLAGEGRTGCVLAAYLIKDRGLGAADALTTLRDVKPEFVEWVQEKSIFDYAAAQSNKRPAGP